MLLNIRYLTVFSLFLLTAAMAAVPVCPVFSGVVDTLNFFLF